jgi:hypothetical protein
LKGLQDQALSGLVTVVKLNNEEQADQSRVWLQWIDSLAHRAN